ncbi:kelch repeat-containing proteins that is fused to a HSP90-like ATpase, related [Neospora caninum Liverpool]|uniref:Kelch repeat-containing proteins that is fused to a HSP90-like ATpase, related n=1 Tax=Neospora caninum (strain Liverpool) TaxID=572307 RepID=F0VAS0_NEOCL|nr:kelch repeat-containing proteins that is fused to a HSP90-like ATpase, related [Neospora caninum Liverpool]CBZ51328.1 kelch repeat-containing proteins that is fused to a HSP90-like ATpase, related [Neospora caninum Liverpool]CEL68644.1 TPA: Kelch repeat-containing proteins that is fused to a HSP90-like ATpase, related [Neospora caninum Liverpool]|eukprot:XP_003881361.1 kelch repeat-containing proteins that is fused to a HSP90-like ATpase, related [Neospora caninum Liverpool]
MATNEAGAPEEDAGGPNCVPETGDSLAAHVPPFPQSLARLESCRCVTNADGHHFLLCEEEENIDILRQSSSSFYPTNPEGVFVLHSPLLSSHLSATACSSSVSDPKSNAGPRRVVAVSIPLAVSKSEREARELLKTHLPEWEAALHAFLSGKEESASSADIAVDKKPREKMSSPELDVRPDGGADPTSGTADSHLAQASVAPNAPPLAPPAPLATDEARPAGGDARGGEDASETVPVASEQSAAGFAAPGVLTKEEPRGDEHEVTDLSTNGRTAKEEHGVPAASSGLGASSLAASDSTAGASANPLPSTEKTQGASNAKGVDSHASIASPSSGAASNGAPPKSPGHALPASSGQLAGGGPQASPGTPSRTPSAAGEASRRGGATLAPASAPPPRRPTLFNLLDALAHDSVTTPDQRNCIRSVVTDFLNHSLPHAKVYTFIGAIVGHDVLHAMVRKLEEQPSRLGAPDQGGLTRIEKAFGLTKTSGAVAGGAAGPAGAGSGTGAAGRLASKCEEEKNQVKNAVLGEANYFQNSGQHARTGGRSHAASGLHGVSGVGPSGATGSAHGPGERDSPLAAVARHAAAATQAQGDGAGRDSRVVVGQSRDEVVKAMRRNLEARRQVQGSVDVFDRVKWLPVRRALTPVPVFGHSLVTFSNTAVLFGGSNTEGAVSFRHVFVVNTNDFSVRGFPMGGDPPCERDGHTTTGLTTAAGPAVILFGGCSQDSFLNDVYMLEVDPKRWVRRHPVGKAPQPRDQHVAAVFPARTETGVCRENSQEVLSEFLFIFGGRIGCPEAYQATNDMWTLHLATDTWTQVLLEGSRLRPPPRFGCCGVWSNDLFLTVFGGETTAPAHGCALARDADRAEDDGDAERALPRLLLDDMWHFKILDVVGAGPDARHARGAHIVGEWTQEKYEGAVAPRSHYSAIFITQRYQEPRAEPRTVERLMLITSGLTYEQDSQRSSGGLNAMPRQDAKLEAAKPRKVVETDKITVYFFSRKKWFTLKPRYPADYVYDLCGARQRHVACFFEAQPLTQRAPRPPVPCLLIHGGFRGKQVLNDAWVLSLTGEDPYRGALFASANRGANAGFGAPSAFAPSSLSSSALQQLAMGRSMLSLRMYPSYYIRETHSPGILWALCGQQRWAFGAISQLVENSLSPVVTSRNVYVTWEESPEKEPMLAIQDDGQGVDYPAMNALLRLFGTFEPGDRMRKSYEYGVGFKIAFGRLSSSCAVMSRTQGTIGVGMLSMELMGHCDAREIVAPMCMWRLPNKELINRDPNNAADHRHHQRLLMSYTPFTTPNLLAEQINLLGTVPGTRLVFWDLRDDLDFLVFDPAEGTLFLNTAPAGERGRKGEAGKAAEGFDVHGAEKAAPVDLPLGKGRQEDITRPRLDADDGPSPAGGPELLDLDEDGQPLPARGGKETGVSEDEKARGPGDAASSAGDGKEATPPGEESAKSGEKRGRLQGSLPPLFPLWTCARHSPDYCLPTYLFWFHLHSPAQLHVQGVPLLPTPASLAKIVEQEACKSEEKRDGAEAHAGQEGAELLQEKDGETRGDEEEEKRKEAREKHEKEELAESPGPGRSLYFFLKERLYCQAELQYLFTPADHATGCFALFGFLNDPCAPLAPGPSAAPRVCEAGVLLYFRQRLIRRLDAAFPDYPKALNAACEPADDSLFGGKDGTGSAEMFKYCLTAVVHVPEWMLPSMTKQDFRHENNLPFMKFKSRLLKLIDEYLRRCRNPQALQAWLEDRARRLREYHEELRRSRPKRRLGEDFTDEERPRRSPTPPVTHSSSGAPIWTGERGSGAAVSLPPVKQRAVARPGAGSSGSWTEERGSEREGEERKEVSAETSKEERMDEGEDRTTPASELEGAQPGGEREKFAEAGSEGASGTGVSSVVDSGDMVAETAGAVPVAGAGDSSGSGTTGALEPNAVVDSEGLSGAGEQALETDV